MSNIVWAESVGKKLKLFFGVAGISVADMRQYLEFIADQRLMMLGLIKA
jgi:ribonucleotide reductase beta subunit family protein with ferritin-like domain